MMRKDESFDMSEDSGLDNGLPGRNNKKVGSVMVVGGGIAAMQSALDLADNGYLVHLVTNSECIGGNMVRLDKVFPTNDCSMCIVSPKLVTVGNHPNINIITMGDVEKCEGEAGNFRIRVRKRARYIDESKCTGCAECVEVCPVKLPDPTNEGLDDRKATFRLYPQAVPNWFAISREGTAPCKTACPAHISCQGYVNLIAAGRFKDALDCIRQRIPFPSVCGRVCYHPCETDCNRGGIDEPVAINQLKRFVSDIELKEAGIIDECEGSAGIEDLSLVSRKEEDERLQRDEKVAIIGAGPAGLTCAHDLALSGFNCTVFEKLPVAGGMLAVGIPEYRLPTRILNYEIDRIRNLGVEIKLNSVIERENGIDRLFESGYKAVFIAIGAHASMRLGVEGEELPHVLSGVEFLRRAKLGEETGLRGRVAIIGGGNVAIDAARTAVRMGVDDVTVVYRRSREEMPAHDWEIEEAANEGVRFEYLVSPVKISEGSLTCVRNRLGEPDESGRRSPVEIEGSEFTINADNVIAAIGQRPETEFLSPDETGIQFTSWKTVSCNAKSLETGREGVFAGGDCVTGPDMAISAIAAGKNAAVSIERYLNGQEIDAPRYEDSLEPPVLLDPDQLGSIKKEKRQNASTIPVGERKGNFREVEKTFTADEAMAEAARCLCCGPCSDCRMCEITCQQDAIDFGQKEQVLEFNVGAAILAPGYETFDPKGTLTQFGYGVYENVYTSIEFERILSASGPTGGHITRRSDGSVPGRVAFIQCVGSRDLSIGKDYCSGVCCMYTAKEAIIGKEHEPDMQCTVFYIDERAHGKNFERYYNSAVNDYGVEYVRGTISGIKELQQTKNLLLTYIGENGKQKVREFDMVVLAVGMEPTGTNHDLAEAFNIKLNRFGFCETDIIEPVVTSREGVYVAGAFQGPKDIPDSVTQASGAACKAMIDLAGERFTQINPEAYPTEKDVSNEEPRIGVMICRCGFNIGSVVDVPEVIEYAKNLPGVVWAEESLYACSGDNLQKIIDTIKEHNLNRFVISSCTVQTHLPLFQQTMKRAGLNKYLFEFANIREHDSWVHRDDPEKATQVAKELTAGAVSRVKRHSPLKVFRNDVIQKALVIGGGVSGMTAALSIADQGHDVYLVEKADQLGGFIKNIKTTLEGADTVAFIEETIARVESHPRISVYKGYTVKAVDGHVGSYKSRLVPADAGTESAAGEKLLNHGVIIVATGGRELVPSLEIGEKHNVLTQTEFGLKVSEQDEQARKAESIVMIQCFEQRNEERPYCSKVCCSAAVKNAIAAKELNPDANVYVLYRDIRTYGFKELKYLEAREKGVIFIRFRDGDDPVISEAGGKVRVAVNDDVLKRELVFEPDILVLSVPIICAEDSAAISVMLKVPVDSDGFFCEAHAKLRPVDFASEGLFLCGVANSPKPLEENVQQAKAAAGRAMIILCRDYLEREGMVAQVNEDLCAACLTCVRVCPYNVPFINERNRAEINGVECQGCGCCAASCPAKAIQVEHFRDDQIVAQEQMIISEACKAPGCK